MSSFKFKIFGPVLLVCLVMSLIGPVFAATPVWSGGPYAFNGSNPVATSGSIGISGNSPWSIAAWVYSYTGGPNNGYGWGIAGWGNAASNQGNYLYYNDAERTFEYGFYGNDAQTSANYNPNTWYHVADTWDGTTQRIYINGTLVTSRTSGSRSLANTTAKIGTDPFGQGRNFKGGMERVQIYNVTLSASEVAALAASAPAWTPGSGSTPTPTRRTATPTPTLTPTPTPPPGEAQPVWSGGPYTFDGSNPVTTSGSIGISGNNPWTMAAWVYSFTGGPNNGYGWGIAGWGNAASNQANFLYYNDAERTFEYGFYGNDAQTAANYNPNTWYHVANTWDGTTQRIYINGTLAASRTPGSRSLTNTTAKIGTDPFGQGRNFKGGMERVQIYNVTLSASQVSSLAAIWPAWTPGSGSTPTPTRRTTATPTPTRRTTATPTPTTIQGMPNPVFSGESYDLTGSNYYQTPVLNISGNQPWTMACWVYQRGTSDEKDPGYQYYRPNPNYVSKCVMGWGSSGTKTANYLYVNPVTMNFEYGFDSASAGTAPNYSHYTWYHVANTYDGTTQRIYINGNLAASRNPGALNLANTAAVIGRDPIGQSRYFTGKVQQVKIYNTALSETQVTSLVATLPTPLNGYGISTAIPSALSFLDTSFYKKCYKTPLGVYIISSNRVGNHSLVLCGEQIDTVMARIKTDWPAVYTSMMNYNCRVVIQSYMEQTTDVPEWRNLTNSNYARGMGGINGSPFSGCGEENVHHESFCAYRDENIIVHEFGHSLQGHGLYNGARSVYDEIRNAYNEAVSKGLWVDTYPGSNFNEYFANAVQTWYNVAAQSSNGQPNGVHNHVNLRSELQTYDPRLYNICASLFNTTLLPPPWMITN